MATNADEVTRLNPIARVILQGLYDIGSPWHKLLGIPHVVRVIWRNVVEYWKSRIRQSHDLERCLQDREELYFDSVENIAFTKISPQFTKSRFYNPSHPVRPVRFPNPGDININMMPFVMERKFEKTKLPGHLRSYWDEMIHFCIVDSEVGKVGFLTIQESAVEAGSSQRRLGIYTETPGVIWLKSRGKIENVGWGGGGVDLYQMDLRGGIYMASNVENLCRVWNCQILGSRKGYPTVVGTHGDIEHLREFLPPSKVMDANFVYWLTDRTPHESLPLSEGTHRQFFRLVTSNVSVWYENHSTKNPLGVTPDPKFTKIIKGSKFDGSCY